MRRLFIVLAAAVLLLASCTTSYTLQEEAELKAILESGVNHVGNSGFETGNADSWGMSDGFAVTSGTAHSGDYALCAIPTGGSEYFYNVLPQDFDLTAGVVASAWIKLPSAFDADKVTFELERQLFGRHDEVTKVNPKMTGEWQQVIIDVPAIELVGVQYLVVKGTANSAVGPVYFDDITLVSLATGDTVKASSAAGVVEYDANSCIYLTNSSLENGDSKIASNWGLAPGWDAVPLSYWGNDAKYSRTGNGYVYIQQVADKEQVLLQADGWQDRSVTEVYDPTKPMLFTAWIKADDVDGDGVYLRVERKYDVNGVEQVLLSSSERFTGTSDGWIKLEAYVEPSDLDFKEVLWDVVVSAGTGAVCVDDLYFEESEAMDVVVTIDDTPEPGENVLRNVSLNDLNPDGTTTHWDVWPGNPSEGIRNSEVIQEEGYGNVLKINLEFGNAQAVYQYCVQDTVGKFNFNEDYVFSCDIKCDGVVSLDGKGVAIGIKRRGVDGNEYNVSQRIDETASGWNTWSISAPEAPVDIIQYDVIVDIGAGVGSVYLDNFSLTLQEPEEEIVLAWE